MRCTPTEPQRPGGRDPRRVPATTSRCSDNRRKLKVRVTVYSMLCIHVWMYGHHIKQSIDQPGRVANLVRDQLKREHFPCPRSRLKIWSRETGSAVPSRVSLLILHTQAESGVYSRDSSRCPRQHPFIFTAILHRVRPEFFGSRNYLPMAFTAESLLAQGQ